MSSQNNLEIKGNLLTNPLAELLAETFSASLTGSFRLERENEKIVIYLNDGKPVFAVSNARRHRLFEILLQAQKIDKQQLLAIPDFTNDLKLAESLKAKNLFSESETNEFFSLQIEEILKTALIWTNGEWIFSPLIRIKESIQFKVELQKLLLDYARNLSPTAVVRRFKSFNEIFGANPSANLNLEMQPQEAFVLSRFEKSFLKIEEVQNLSGLPGTAIMPILYSLWLGGFIYRENWNSAFSERKISEISSAKLSLKKDETVSQNQEETVPVSKQSPPSKKPETAPPVANQPANGDSKLIPLEVYLELAENSSSYYELFGVSTDADLSEIKRAYFSFAKQFHPDKYHQEKNPELLQRIQGAFTLTAQAYETLKNPDARKTYDYKLSKYLENLKTKEKTTDISGADENPQTDMAKESFDQGFNLLMDGELDDSLPFLARAVQLAPDVARYHAFYGKALSSDGTQRFKADAEMQTAVRLEPRNATFRIILAEFYIEFELFKRAEGELRRLLTIHPDNKEALALLDSLPKK